MANVTVEVFDGNVEYAIKKLKGEIIKRGVLKEMRKHESYEKPSVAKRHKSTEARKRERMRMRPMIERERMLEGRGL